jgi:mono/diheme cytochrome c family protein
VNANTVYGYSGQSFNSIASFYGDYNAMALFQMANRQQENAQKGADQAGKQFAELLAQEGGNRSRVAEIMAKAELLRAMFPPESRIETKSSSWKSEPPPMPSVDPPQAQLEPVALKQAWAGHAAKACGACHGGGKAEGGFALASYPTMDAAGKAAVRARLDHPQEKRRMPKDAPPLVAADRRLWDW